MAASLLTCARGRTAIFVKSVTTCQRRKLHATMRRDCLSSSLTVCTLKNGVKTVTMNNPKQRNALSFAMLEQLQRDVMDLDGDVRVIVLAGNGPVFSSGHDLKQLTGDVRERNMAMFVAASQLASTLQALSLPVIAKVRGLAAAAGCQLAASCDLVVASDKATFSTPGVNIGLFCSTPGVAVARALPRKVSLMMLMTGDAITAEEAHKFGMVSKVVADEDLDEETEKMAEKIARHSKPVVGMGKACFYRQTATHCRDTAYRDAENVMVENLALDDGQEGIRAFIEKRKPQWRHSQTKVH